MLLKNPASFKTYQERRKLLKEKVFSSGPGVVVLCATLEEPRHIFKQESSFYYLTGISEPGAVVALFSDGQEIVYIPHFGNERTKWVTVHLTTNDEDQGACAYKLGFSSIKYLGKQKAGYTLSSLFDQEQYVYLRNDLESALSSNNTSTLYTLIAPLTDLYTVPYGRFMNIIAQRGSSTLRAEDIAPTVHEMRRTKAPEEIDVLQKAVDITVQAHQKAAALIKHGIKEYQVRAEIERTFVHEGALGPSFPSIVATGKNSTILHYTDLDQTLSQNDLVVVDIGALYGYYAADITRTYPVGGVFSPRQREIYNAVLETQMYAARLAKPGMFLRNPDQPEASLHHLAVAYLKQKGLDTYFVHGLGHFLGMDVHDVGNARIPLRVGDVFTIEPGIYIPEENLGVRIEDDYVITPSGAHCLSEALPKSVKEVEEMMCATRC